MMCVIRNTWVEKLKKKKEKETAPSYAREPRVDTYDPNAEKVKKRFSTPSTSILVKTLRGVRK